jgi:hypothetical protein
MLGVDLLIYVSVDRTLVVWQIERGGAEERGGEERDRGREEGRSKCCRRETRSSLVCA